MKTYGSVSDAGGQTYKTVVIGTQTWMAENLNYDDVVGKCFNDNLDNCVIYGRLYNWATAMLACPSGWHLPSDADWNELMKFVDPSCTDNSSCANAGTKLKATSGWISPIIVGTDDFGFSALPGGFAENSSFINVNMNGHWWSASDSSNDAAYFRNMSYYGSYVSYEQMSKSNHNSVRCIKD